MPLKAFKNFSEVPFRYSVLVYLGKTFETSTLQRFRAWAQAPRGTFVFDKNAAAVRSFDRVFFQTHEQKEKLREACWLSEGEKILCPTLGLSITAPQQWHFRFFRPGDRYQGKKLKDLFQKHRIPVIERSVFPVAEGPDQNLVWHRLVDHPAVTVTWKN
jgi:tRNA(Ile)-lysidine synthetase-like protein